MKSFEKSKEKHWTFTDFANLSILQRSWGVSGPLEATWRHLWAVQRRLGGALGGLRGVLEVSWRRLGASWGHLGRLGENVEKRSREFCFLEGFWEPKWKQKSFNYQYYHWNSCKKCNLLFLAFLNICLLIFHVFESQLVKTCPRKILAKHWLGTQKLRFAKD